MGLMSTLGLGLLGWYYARPSRTSRRRRTRPRAAIAHAGAGRDAAASLGRIDPPALARAVPRTHDAVGALAAAAAPAEARPVARGHAHQEPCGRCAPEGYGPARRARSTGAWTSPRASRRRRDSERPAVSRARIARSARRIGAAEPAYGRRRRPERAQGGRLGRVAAPACDRRSRRPSAPGCCRRSGCCCPKGAFIDCTLETAIDSHAAGHDDLHHRDRHLRCRWQGGAARARHQAGRARPAARCSRAPRACSCSGPRRARPPASSCRSPPPAPMSSAARGSPGEVNRHFLRALWRRDPDLGHRWRDPGGGRRRTATAGHRHLQPEPPRRTS